LLVLTNDSLNLVEAGIKSIKQTNNASTKKTLRSFPAGSEKQKVSLNFPTKTKGTTVRT
jgi:hypothetical protein